MIAREDDDCVLAETEFVHGAEQAAEVVVQVRYHCVVSRDGLPIIALHVRPLPNLRRVVHREVLVGSDVRVVRRSPGQEQAERVLSVLAHEVDRQACVPVGFVTRQSQAFGCIHAHEAVEVVVRTVPHSPVIEPLAAVLRNERLAVPLQVPFADVAGLVALLLQHLRDGDLTVRQRDVVRDHAVRLAVAAGEQHRPVRRAQRIAAVRVGEERALAGHAIHIGRLDLRIAHAAHRLGTHLIRESDDDVRRPTIPPAESVEHGRPQCQPGTDRCSPLQEVAPCEFAVLLLRH